ncbi:MAG: hypothetical protein HDR01_11760 [Lachnospiraceae bacterium]|nr:hypothetical protein [Lachnospiraceae bacterium]
MELHEYLDTLSEQIRCKKARPVIIEEMEKHIEDQAQAYRKEGMGEEKAMAKAVLEMGDPVEAGIALDRVHRPKMQWTLVALVVLLSMIGMIMQIVIFKTGCLSNEENITTIRDEFIYKSIWNTVISFGVIAAVCIMDYTFLGKHPVALWWLFCFLQVLGGLSYMGGSYIRGYQFSYYGFTLMVPVFAAVVFRYKNKGMIGFLKCIGLYLALVLIKMFTQIAFVSGILELTICVLIILTVAIMRGWFGEKKVAKLAFIWVPAIGFPTILVSIALFFNDKIRVFASYQVARIQAIFHLNSEINYQTLTARAEMEKVTLFGSRELPLTTLPAIQNDYIITSMFTYFGALFTLLVLGMILFFVFKAFHLSIRQKNQLGSMISIGCVVVLLAKIVVYVISNVGGNIIFGQMSMPFLSYGLGNAVINGVLVGLLLSVYRNTNIVSENNIKAKYIFRFPVEKA